MDKKNPVEEFLTTKEAAWDQQVFKGMGESLLKDAPHQLGSALATGTVMAGAAGIGVAANKIYEAVTKRHDFRQMLEYNPDLHEELAKNPKQFNQMFTTLRKFNPQFSADPLVSGHYMRHMASEPATAGRMAVEALEHRPPPSAIGEGFARGAQEGAKKPR